MMPNDSRRHDGSGSGVLLEFPAAGNSAGNCFGIGADLAILETVDAVIPVACGKFPAVAGQGILARAAGNFPRQGRDFLRRAGNSPAVVGTMKSIDESRENIP
jgi:hypothetical protein